MAKDYYDILGVQKNASKDDPVRNNGRHAPCFVQGKKW